MQVDQWCSHVDGDDVDAQSNSQGPGSGAGSKAAAPDAAAGAEAGVEDSAAGAGAAAAAATLPLTEAALSAHSMRQQLRGHPAIAAAGALGGPLDGSVYIGAAPHLQRRSSSPLSSGTSIDGHPLATGPAAGRGASTDSLGPSPLPDDSADDDAHQLARARTAEVLRQRKLKKQRLRLAAEKFNEKPLKADWVHFALSLGLLQAAPVAERDDAERKDGVDAAGAAAGANEEGSANDTSAGSSTSTSNGSGSGNGSSSSGSGNGGKKPPVAGDTALAVADAASVATFLKQTPGLGRVQIGEFLSKGPREMYPFHAEVLRCYVETFDFRGGRGRDGGPPGGDGDASFR